MPDLDDFLDQLPLSQNERNIISFKNVLGLLNTTTFNTLLSQEKIAKSFNIYNDDILSDTVNNAFTSQQLSFLKQREWSLNTGTDTTFVPNLEPTETTPDELGTGGVSNPNVEKIIIPLTKVSETNDQLYVAYDPSFYIDTDGNNLYAAPQSDHSYNTSGNNIVR